MSLMDGGPESERIEIELTSNADPADGSRWHHPSDRRPDDQTADPAARPVGEVVVGEPVGSPEDSSSSGQRRLYTTATLVGVFALLLGWLIGRAGGTDGSVAPTATTAGTTVEVTTTFLPSEEIPRVVTTTVADARPTTTLQSPTLAAVEVDPRLAGVDLTLVGVTDSRKLVELDLAGQTLLERPMPRYSSIDTGAMVVGDHWIVFGSQSGQSLVFYDDGESETVTLGDAWQLLWQPDTDRFWRIVGYSSGGWVEPLAYEEVDLHGVTTGATIEVPPGSWASAVDPDGSLIVDAAGKSYSVSESSAELIAHGVLLGLSGDLAVFRDCDDQLRCGVWVTDRATAETRELGSASNQDTTYEPTYNWGGVRNPAVSPDGTMCAVIARSAGEYAVGLLDLGTGEFVQLDKAFNIPTVVWSPDGRFAFFLGEGLAAYDRESGDVFPVLSEPQQWFALGARPSGS